MDRFYYYMDFGSGFVQINPHKISAKLGIRRGDINDFISRKYFDGSFALIDSEAQLAFTYFITNGEYEVEMQVYEHGLSGVGTLIYEGYARAKGVFDLNSGTATFNEFRTKDEYGDLLLVLNESLVAELVPSLYDGYFFDEFTIQGINSNCNKLQAYSWSGSSWGATGNALSIPNIGRVAATNDNGSMVLYDNYNKTISRYTYTYPNWALSATGTSLQLANETGNGTLCQYSTNYIAFLDDYHNELRKYHAVSGTWTLISTRAIGATQFPSMAYVTLDGTGSDVIAIVDELSGNLQTYKINPGTLPHLPDFNLGNIKKPSMCSLNRTSGSASIAVADAGTGTLRAYSISTLTGIIKLAELSIAGVNEPVVSYESNDIINLYDAQTGTLQRYTYASQTFTASGSSTSIGGGYSSAMAYDGSVLGLISSDSYVLNTRLAQSYSHLLNGLLYKLFDFSNDIIFSDTDNEGTFDFSKLAIAALDTTRERYEGSIIDNLQKYTLKQILDLAELFQNYWYVKYDPIGGYDYQIKFTQPNLFSSVGTDIDVSEYYELLNSREYLDEFQIDKENLSFLNAYNDDFEGELIEYNRNTPTLLEDAMKYSADAAYLQNSLLGLNFNYELNGLMLLYGTYTFPRFLVEAGAGISGDTNVKNEELSKRRIQDTYWKDYRYTNVGNISINGVDSPVQATCRRIIAFPDVEMNIANFPDDIASADWGGGVKSYVTELSVNLNTYKFTVKSRLLDI